MAIMITKIETYLSKNSYFIISFPGFHLLHLSYQIGLVSALHAQSLFTVEHCTSPSTPEIWHNAKARSNLRARDCACSPPLKHVDLYSSKNDSMGMSRKLVKRYVDYQKEVSFMDIRCLSYGLRIHQNGDASHFHTL